MFIFQINWHFKLLFFTKLRLSYIFFSIFYVLLFLMHLMMCNNLELNHWRIRNHLHLYSMYVRLANYQSISNHEEVNFERIVFIFLINWSSIRRPIVYLTTIFDFHICKIICRFLLYHLENLILERLNFLLHFLGLYRLIYCNEQYVAIKYTIFFSQEQWSSIKLTISRLLINSPKKKLMI